jgi:hypothetical protein
VRFEFPEEEFLKVGIGVEGSGRVRMHQSGGAELIETATGSLAECYVAEQIVLNEHVDELVIPNATLPAAGKTECLKLETLSTLRPLQKWIRTARDCIENGELPPMRAGFRPAINDTSTAWRPPQG